MTQTKSHLRLRALCEGAIFIALAQVLSYLKLYELPQGGSITIEMLPIFLYCARWGFGPGMLASFAYSILQALLSARMRGHGSRSSATICSHSRRSVLPARARSSRAAFSTARSWAAWLAFSCTMSSVRRSGRNTCPRLSSV